MALVPSSSDGATPALAAVLSAGNTASGAEIVGVGREVITGADDGGLAVLQVSQPAAPSTDLLELKIGAYAAYFTVNNNGGVEAKPLATLGAGGMAFRINDRNGNVILNVRGDGVLTMPSLPIAAPAVSGALWNNAGVLNVVP